MTESLRKSWGQCSASMLLSDSSNHCLSVASQDSGGRGKWEELPDNVILQETTMSMIGPRSSSKNTSQ